MNPTVAFLSRGRLFVRKPGAEAREIESRFAQQAMERQTRSQQIDGWKDRSGVWGSMGMEPPEWSQWDQAAAGDRRPIVFRCIAGGGKSDELYYVLDMGDVSGVFRYHLENDVEYRLMHRNEFLARALACHPDGVLAVSELRMDGTTGLAFSENEGRHWNAVTGGDSIDEAPSWIPGKKQVVFQSAAIGRNEQGYQVGQAPYVIETLSLDGRESTVIHQEEGNDLLLPRVLADGSTYFIRRPYQANTNQGPHLKDLLLDVVLFPVRLLRAIFHYLNFYSMMYSGKPLSTTAKQNPWSPDQQRFMMLWGQMIDTKRAMASAQSGDETQLIPESWQLVMRRPDGEEEVVASNVLSYDLCFDGGVVYTNGTRIVHRDPKGNEQELCRSELIDQLIVV